MSRKYILVDFENVQPSSLGALKAGDAYVKVFAGAHQNRVDLALAQALQPFGTHAEYIQIVGSGKDALDFHIAFYIGRLSAEHPGASFTIVSRDTGFDPLVKHLAKLGVTCKRVATIEGAAVKLPAAVAPAPAPAPPAKVAKVAKAPAKKAAKAPAPAKATKASKAVAAMPPRLQEVIDRLAGMKRAQPRTLKTLRSWLASFNPPFVDSEIDVMVQGLQKRKILSVEGTKIVYPA